MSVNGSNWIGQYRTKRFRLHLNPVPRNRYQQWHLAPFKQQSCGQFRVHTVYDCAWAVNRKNELGPQWKKAFINGLMDRKY